MFRLIASVSFSILCLVPCYTFAGGGPENVVLVVNADSRSSKLIANYYVAGRRIPANHVIYLNGIPDQETITFDQFHDLILQPVIKAITDRKLLGAIDYIIYSADFPTIINVTSISKPLLDSLKAQGQDKFFRPSASINSLTYFAPIALAKNSAFMAPTANTYYRGPAKNMLEHPFVGPQQQEFADALVALADKEPENLKNSIATLKEILERNPNQVAVSYALARMHAQLNQPQEAATYLAQAVRMGWCYRSEAANDPLFTLVANDEIFRKVVEQIPDKPFEFLPTTGFKQIFPWGVNGMLNHEPGQGNHYFLSTVLATTRNNGNSEQEALEQLKASIRADSTHPQGTFYFTNTADVRTKTRTSQFSSAINALKALGHRAEIIQTKMPVDAPDVLGLSSGTSSFNWTTTGSKIIAGAICENLTSYGGIMSSDSQTKLSEFLRHKAAGSSGTVTEPYTIQTKFPHALIHAHYASGCSLAEAYYQAVSGPYQLLIVGDPLCQPWAKPPAFTVSGVEGGSEVTGTAHFSFHWDTKVPIGLLEIYLDGVPVYRGPPRSRTGFDTTAVSESTGVSDGYHELRFVAIAGDTIQATERVIVPIRVNNHGLSTHLKPKREKFLESDTVTFQATSNHGDSIELRHNHRSIAKKIGREVEFEVPAHILGRGPVYVDAISIDEETGNAVGSPPVRIEIEGLISERPRKTEK